MEGAFTRILLVVNIIFTIALWQQLLALRGDVKTVVKSVDTALGVLDGLRVSVAGSLVEKAKLVSNGYAVLSDRMHALFPGGNN